MPSTWDALRVWINEQETVEIQTGRPPSLTPAQRNAISTLLPTQPTAASTSVQARVAGPGSAPAPATAPGRRPDVDPRFEDTDWVTTLNLHIQEGRHRQPDYTAERRELDPSNPGTDVKWAATCTVYYLNASFPNEDHGFINGRSPCFSTKKMAKRYAAMCAMHCADALLASPLPNFSPPHPAPQLTGPAVIKQESADDANGVRLAPDGDEPGALQHVPILCKRLGMIAPRFETRPNAKNPNLYDAWPIFTDSFMEDFPESFGVVTGILEKKAAKEAAAEKVLVWLKEKLRERSEEHQALLPP